MKKKLEIFKKIKLALTLPIKDEPSVLAKTKYNFESPTELPEQTILAYKKFKSFTK